MPDRLDSRKLPVQFGFETDHVLDRAITRAQDELSERTTRDGDRYSGYYPGGSGYGVESGLPRAKKMITAMPTIEVGKRTLDFNFLHLSLGAQLRREPWHLDSDPSSVHPTNLEAGQTAVMWRALLNLGTINDHVVEYLDVEPNSVGLTAQDGYACFPDATYDQDYARRITLPAREGLLVCGVLFAASQILHRDNSSDDSHFVASYGLEEAA